MGNRAFICNQQQQAHRRREVVRPRRRLLHLHLEGRLVGLLNILGGRAEEDQFACLLVLYDPHPFSLRTTKAFAPVLVSMGNRL